MPQPLQLKRERDLASPRDLHREPIPPEVRRRAATGEEKRRPRRFVSTRLPAFLGISDGATRSAFVAK